MPKADWDQSKFFELLETLTRLCGGNAPVYKGYPVQRWQVHFKGILHEAPTMEQLMEQVKGDELYGV